MGRVSTDFGLVVTTVDSEAKANEIAHDVVERGLAACVQIAPVRSIYRWRGAIEEALEYRLEIKMRVADYSLLEAAILALHPYEIAEIVRLEIADGHAPYLAWLGARD